MESVLVFLVRRDTGRNLEPLAVDVGRQGDAEEVLFARSASLPVQLQCEAPSLNCLATH